MATEEERQRAAALTVSTTIGTGTTSTLSTADGGLGGLANSMSGPSTVTTAASGPLTSTFV